MANTVTRRPLPALISLVALLLLTGLVWWRVLHRDSGSAATPTPCPSSSAVTTVHLPAPSSVTIVMLNSTSRAGIAARARSILAQDGFNVPTLAQNDSPKKRDKIRTTAEIRFGPRARAAAALVHYYFPGATLVAVKSTSTAVVVSLGTKFTTVAAAAAVRRAQAANHVALDASAPTPTPSTSTSPSPSPSC